MAVQKCDNGHFYDDEKFEKCPHCEAPLPKKRAMNDELTQYGIPSSFMQSSNQSGSYKIDLGGFSSNDERTVGIYKEKMGVEPVVGWLVCTKGKEKGRAYNLHVGRNFIGRSVKSDIAIPDDESVSGEDHCSLVFEPNKIIFLLARGRGEIVVVNGEVLENSIVLKGDEIIEIGTSNFTFVPYCKEGRLW